MSRSSEILYLIKNNHYHKAREDDILYLMSTGDKNIIDILTKSSNAKIRIFVSSYGGEISKGISNILLNDKDVNIRYAIKAKLSIIPDFGELSSHDIGYSFEDFCKEFNV